MHHACNSANITEDLNVHACNAADIPEDLTGALLLVRLEVTRAALVEDSVVARQVLPAARVRVLELVDQRIHSVCWEHRVVARLVLPVCCCTHTHTHTHTRAHTHTHTHTRARAHTHTHTHIHKYTHTYTCTFTCNTLVLPNCSQKTGTSVTHCTPETPNSVTQLFITQ